MGIHYFLLQSFLLSGFPSGSSINYYNDRFFIIGDDSNYVLILDKNYRRIDSVNLFNYAGKRIPKTDKIDLESSTIVERGGKSYLFMSGSGSGKLRKKIITIPILEDGRVKIPLDEGTIQTDEFVQRIDSAVGEINLEGLTTWNEKLIFGNRGNLSNKKNHLIITDADFWQRQKDASIQIKELALPDNLSALPLGLSELCYVSELDILFITFTSEATSNSYDDGKIGDSFLAVLKQATTQLKNPRVQLQDVTNLTEVHPALMSQKIEGICAQRTGNKIILHLVSDNDNGESHLFKLKVKIK
jgi:hypothetical protein